MRFKLRSTFILAAGFMALSAIAQIPQLATKSPEPPDKQKVSYALGMRLGLQVTRGGRPEVDANTVARGVKDMLEGKPAQLQEAEITSLLRQAQTYAVAKSSATNHPDNVLDALKPAPKLPEPPDKGKFSYALGMRLGQQLKHVDADVDVATIAQGVSDVVDGKPTQIEEAQIQPLFMQAQAYGMAREGEKNKVAGEAFLAQNAKAEGITVLPNGLQYRVLQPGTGEIPSTNNLIMIKYRGVFINGAEFDHNDHFVTRSAVGIKGWQEALQRMKAGSKWQLFVPSELAYGHEGLQRRQVGPDATLIYEMELLSILPPGAQIGEQYGTGRLGHGLVPDVSSARPTNSVTPSKGQ